MPVSLGFRPGWSCGSALSWERMSGEALIRTQLRESVLTAIEDWVRDVALSVPSRIPRQLGQLQFHCGKPPPAAAPRTRTLISSLSISQAVTVTSRRDLQQNRPSAAEASVPMLDCAQPACLLSNYQRFQMYIVTSKPKRSSTKVGLLQTIGFS